MLCGHLEGWAGAGGAREVQEGGDICIPVADSRWCMAETNTTMQSNHPCSMPGFTSKKVARVSIGTDSPADRIAPFGN